MKSGINTSFNDLLTMIENGEDNQHLFAIVDAANVDFLNESTVGNGLTNNLLLQALIVGNRPLYKRLIEKGARYPELLYAKSSIGGLENPEDRWHGLTQSEKQERLLTIQWMLSSIYADFENNLDELNRMNLLWFAIYFRAIHLVQGLCLLGVNLELTGSRNSLPLDLALSSINSLEIADVLRAHGADILKTDALAHYANHGMNHFALKLLKRFRAAYQQDIATHAPTNSKVFRALKTALLPLNVNDYKRTELIEYSAEMLPIEALETAFHITRHCLNNTLQKWITAAIAKAKPHSFVIQLQDPDDNEPDPIFSQNNAVKVSARFSRDKQIDVKACLTALTQALEHNLFRDLATFYYHPSFCNDIDVIFESLPIDEITNNLKFMIKQQICQAQRGYKWTALNQVQVICFLDLQKALKIENSKDLFPQCNFRRFSYFNYMLLAFCEASLNIPDTTRVASFLVGLRGCANLKLHRAMRGISISKTFNPDFDIMFNILSSHIVLDAFKYCIETGLFSILLLQQGVVQLQAWLKETTDTLSKKYNIHLGQTTIDKMDSLIRSCRKPSCFSRFFVIPCDLTTAQSESYQNLNETLSELAPVCYVPQIEEWGVRSTQPSKKLENCAHE